MPASATHQLTGEVSHEDLTAPRRGTQASGLDHRRAVPVVLFARRLADGDADPKPQAEQRVLAVETADATLHRNGTTDRVADAGREQHEQAVTGGLHF